eukprot:COSAG05_NODE_5662_length_1120_cov_1.015671_1_plen_42_part_10
MRLLLASSEDVGSRLGVSYTPGGAMYARSRRRDFFHMPPPLT